VQQDRVTRKVPVTWLRRGKWNISCSVVWVRVWCRSRVSSVQKVMGARGLLEIICSIRERLVGVEHVVGGCVVWGIKGNWQAGEWVRHGSLEWCGSSEWVCWVVGWCGAVWLCGWLHHRRHGHQAVWRHCHRCGRGDRRWLMLNSCGCIGG